MKIDELKRQAGLDIHPREAQVSIQIMVWWKGNPKDVRFYFVEKCRSEYTKKSGEAVESDEQNEEDVKANCSTRPVQCGRMIC